MEHIVQFTRKLQVIAEEEAIKSTKINNIVYMNLHHMKNLPKNLLHDFLNIMLFVRDNKVNDNNFKSKYEYYMANKAVLTKVITYLTQHSKPNDKSRTLSLLLKFYDKIGFSVIDFVDYMVIVNYIDKNIMLAEDIGEFKHKLNEYLVDISDSEEIDIKVVKESILNVIPDLFDVKGEEDKIEVVDFDKDEDEDEDDYIRLFGNIDNDYVRREFEDFHSGYQGEIA